MKPLQVLPTRPETLLSRIVAGWRREARTPMGGRVISLGGSGAVAWTLACIVSAPLLLVGVASMVKVM